MGKKKDKTVEDIEFEILAAEARLEVLKKKKAKLDKNNFRTTNFNNLLSSIENIAAHIAIRVEEPVVILSCFVTDKFIIYYKNSLLGEEIFNEHGNHITTRFDIEPVCEFSHKSHEQILDYIAYFGCVINPDGDEYSIESMKINSDGQIVFEED